MTAISNSKEKNKELNESNFIHKKVCISDPGDYGHAGHGISQNWKQTTSIRLGAIAFIGT